MQEVVNPNLIPTQTFTYKDLLIGKLVRAVASSVSSQFVILLIYIIVANVNVYHPLEWMSAILSTLTNVSTWFFLIIFLSIIFIQSLICAKDYVLNNAYSSTRFQQLLHVFSFHNFILLTLHVIVGGAFTWQILVIVDSRIKNLTVRCKIDKYCLVQDTFFLIVGGLWTGFYYFLKVYMFTQLVFPVVQQRKFLQFRSHLPLLFKDSLKWSLWPSVYFVAFYYLWGNQLENQFIYFVNLDKSVRESSLVYLYFWWFSALYCFSMNLIRYFFSLFLTESVQFSLTKDSVYVLTLQEALVMDNLPIVQNLACLDLFLLSQWAPARRQVFFTLSQPGGHPHNWNMLVENVVKLLTEYTNLLKKSTEPPQAPKLEPQVQSPDTLKYTNLRNMSINNDYFDVVQVSQNTTVDSIKNRVNEKVEKFLNVVKTFFGINFLFGELPQANIQKCLSNGQLIIWASQGISELVAVSLLEDKYGIVQKDVPVILTTLVQLKQNLDKLNKIPSLSRKVAALDDFNYKMKNAVAAAVKRSLFNICLCFGDYFKDFPLSKETVQYLQTNVMLKNCN